MDRPTAQRVLGIDDATPAREVRSRYLALLRASHPDVANASDVDPALVTDAYRVVRATQPPGRCASSAPVAAVEAMGDTISVDLPADEAFLALLDVAASVGSVTYVDADAGLLETMIVLSTGATCSLVVSLQGRANGATEAFCTVEPLTGGAPPPVDELVTELASLLAASLS